MVGDTAVVVAAALEMTQSDQNGWCLWSQIYNGKSVKRWQSTSSLIGTDQEIWAVTIKSLSGWSLQGDHAQQSFHWRDSLSLFSLHLFSTYFYVCVSTWHACTRYIACHSRSGQKITCEDSSVLLLSGFWGSSSGFQGQQKSLLPTEQPYQPL